MPERAIRAIRANEGRQAVAARRGKPSEPDSEHHDEKKAKPVDGHCLPDEDTHRAEGVENGVATERGQDAGGDGHQEGKAEAGRRELKGRRQCLGDEGEGRDLVL